ncbi:hypothetical protein H4R19_001512 [Coemansia spiralis]|nr:hypothetical protein H4R19_001512 [Coemansia spiralis]
MKPTASLGTLPDDIVECIVRHVAAGSKHDATLSALLQLNRLWRHHARGRYYAAAMVDFPAHSRAQRHQLPIPRLTRELLHDHGQFVVRLEVFIDVCAIVAGAEDPTAAAVMLHGCNTLPRARQVTFTVYYADLHSLLDGGEQLAVADVVERVMEALCSAAELACRVAPNATQLCVFGNSQQAPTVHMLDLQAAITDGLAGVLASPPAASPGWRRLQEITIAETMGSANTLNLVRRSAATLRTLVIGRADTALLGALVRYSGSPSGVLEYPQLTTLQISMSLGAVDSADPAESISGAFPCLERLTYGGTAPMSLADVLDERGPCLRYLSLAIGCPLAQRLVTGRMLDRAAFASLRVLQVEFAPTNGCSVFLGHKARMVERVAQMCPRLARLRLAGLRGDGLSGLLSGRVFPRTLHTMDLPDIGPSHIDACIQFAQGIKEANPHIDTVKVGLRIDDPSEADLAVLNDGSAR